MIKSKINGRKTFITLCLIACIVAFAFSAFFAFASFAEVNNVDITKNQKFDADNRNGTLYTFKSDSNITLLENASGDFDIEMRVVPSEIGTADFDRLTVLLKDVNTNLGVQMSLYRNIAENKDGTKTVSYRYSMQMTHPDKEVSLARELWGADTKLDGTGYITRFVFDTDTFELSYYKAGAKKLAYDLDDPSYLAQLGTRTACQGFENYSVEVSVSGIEEDKQAKVLIYSINGQDMSGEEYANTAGAVLATKPLLNNGVIDEEYKVDTSCLKTADVIDGLSDFNGTIKEVAPSGKEIYLADGKFTPSEVGTYKLHFDAKDKAGLSGQTKIYEIYVYGYHPETNIDLAYPVGNVMLGKGATLYIPKAVANSELTLYGEKPSVSLKLFSGETELQSFDANVFNQHVFNDAGSYTLVYSVTDALGKIFTSEHTITVSADLPVINVGANFNDLVVLNDKVVIPTASSSNGKAVTKVIYYPDGRSLSSSCIKADVYGLYTVIYTVETDNGSYSYSRYFNVMQTASSLWQNVKGTIIESDVDTPYYSAIDKNGVMITATRENATVQYLNPIDLSDNEKTDTLVEFLITPDTNGVAEFNVLMLTLTDVNDPNKFIKIHFEKDAYGDLYVVRPYVQTDKNASAYNYGILDKIEAEGLNSNPYKQQSIKGSYSGMFSRYGVTYPANTIKIHFDYENLTLYASIKNDGQIYSKIAKLDDAYLVGQGNEWTGFTSDKAYLTMTFQKVVSSQAHVMVFNVDGQDLSGEKVTDVTPPYVDIDFKGNAEDDLPYAAVNKDYPLFTATATDLVAGDCGVPSVKVYRLDNGKKVKTYIYDYDSFKPDRTGTYVLEYTARDLSGNVAIREVFVEARDKFDELTYDFGAIVSTAKIGSYVTVPEGVSGGGSGVKTVTTQVVVGEKEIEIVEGQFFAEEVGEFTVKVTLKDYVGNEKEFTHTITVTPNDKPVFISATVPKAVIVGKKVDFSNLTAYEYVDSVRQDVPITVSVNGVAIDNPSSYVFTEAGEYSIEFKAQGQTGTDIETYTVNALKPSEGQAGFLMDYFFKENVDIDGAETSLLFNATATNAGFTFANSVSAVDLNLSFTVPKENNAMDGVRIRLTDSVDANKVLVFEIMKGEETTTNSLINVVGVESKYMEGSFFGTTNAPFTLNYNNSTFEIRDYSDNLITTINKVDGKTWKGFTSEKVYVDFEFINCQVGAQISLSDINNQIFSGTAKKDRIAPQVFYPSVNKVMNYGETLMLKGAKAFDVLNEVTSFTVSVISPSGSTVLSGVDANKENSVTFNEYGEYSIKYTAVDGAGKDVTRTAAVNIKNKQIPTITVDGKVAESAKIGKTVKLPKATAIGAEMDVNVFVTVISPNGKMNVMDNNEFTFNVAGKYKVIYYAVDAYGNSAQQIFYIDVE